MKELDDDAEVGLGMTNFDHSIDSGFEDALRSGEGRVWGRHAGWNFNGRVWYEDGKFHEQVWCYRVPVGELSAGSLEELMRVVSDEYGYD